MGPTKEGVRFVSANGKERGNFGTESVAFRPKSGMVGKGGFGGRMSPARSADDCVTEVLVKS